MWNPNAVLAETFIEREKGRWVVYLEVSFWELEKAGDEQFETVRHRIQDYAKKREAEIAANLVKRAANRDLPAPPTGL
ncbi:MAG TPA: AP2 domain-containing protein [Anaerolineae bacterium]|nr:AP2 domain-containing protein [Anaerolineae bacterium]